MDLQPLVGETYARLADALEGSPGEIWDADSLCDGWRVREVVAHVSTPARLDPEQFGAELAAVGGDFQKLNDIIAARDSSLAIAEHLANLRSPTLAAWQPGRFGAVGALNHAVVHSLDITNAVGLPTMFSPDAAGSVLDSLSAGGVASLFDVDLARWRLQATDLDWVWGDGEPLSAPSGDLISLACHRTLTDGRTLA